MDAATNSLNVLLVSPEFEDGSGLFKIPASLHARGVRARIPALGLLTVAAMLPPDTPTRWRDQCVEPLTDDDLAWADVLFLTGMVTQDASMREVISRENAAGVPVVAGGPHATTYYQHLPGIDHLVWGEAELVFKRLWADLLAGTALKAYARPTRPDHVAALLAFYGEDCDVEQLSKGIDVAMAPLPRYDLVDLQRYTDMALQTSRGCPIGCEFCDIWRRFGLPSRYKPTDLVVAELNQLYALGWRGRIYVVADNFIGQRRHATETLQAILAWQEAHDHPFTFFTETTADLADSPELLELMWKVGFSMVFLGIETPVAASLKETRKFVNLKRSMVERVHAIQARGIPVMAGMIIGFDNDPDEIADLIIAHIEDMAVPLAQVGILAALPDTDLWERLERDGRLRVANYGQEYEITFDTKRPAATIQADFVRILDSLYPEDLDAYFGRAARMRDRLGAPYRNKVRRRDVVGFLLSPTGRAALAPVMKHPARANALRYLTETLAKKWWYFPTAVRVTLTGLHYRDVAVRVAEQVRRHAA